MMFVKRFSNAFFVHFRSDQESEEEIDDPRLRRLKAIEAARSEGTDDRLDRHRRFVQKPERVDSSSSSESEVEERQIRHHDGFENEHQRTRRISICSESESDSDVSDTEIERRRQMLKEKMLQQKREEEVLQKEEERKSASSDEESSEYEEDDSEEDHEPRIKPQFVRRKERTTIIEKEKDLIKQKQLEVEAKKQAKERRRYTLKLVEDSIKKDMEAQKAEKDPHINDVQTDDDDELEYEAWKLRELKRIKRERDERDALEKEKNEIDKLRNMTEEDRRKELQSNPKLVTNKGVKGKYKFLQKYYHRGAFYLDKEENVFKQDFSMPTLEDHFDKTILPKVMQVKNFGRCGRTKYTHLVDQDTTKFDSPWMSETTGNVKFVQERAGGMKQNFDRPSYSNRKKE